MVEPEMAFFDFEDLQFFVEAFIKDLFKQTRSLCVDELAFFSQYIDKELMDRYEGTISQSFEKMSYTEAVKLLITLDREFQIKPELGVDLSTEHERFLADEYFKKPVIVTDYPSKIKPFYMRENEATGTVACLDILIPGIGEILTGSQREERFDILQAKMDHLSLSEQERWYLDLRRWGTVPHSGFGMGLDRLVMALSGMKNIKDVLPFPRAARRIW